MTGSHITSCVWFSIVSYVWFSHFIFPGLKKIELHSGTGDQCVCVCSNVSLIYSQIFSLFSVSRRASFSVFHYPEAVAHMVEFMSELLVKTTKMCHVLIATVCETKTNFLSCS